jgi:CRISPR/Cas system-associated exonuclease Cas4 (RecB family)
MSDRPHWSYSSISQYLRCPLQFFFQRILGVPSRTVSSSLVLGGAVHEGLAEYHRRLQRNEAVVTAEIIEVFHSSWKKRETSGEIVYRDGDSRDDSIAQGVHLLNVYMAEPPPERIVAVEQEFVAPLLNSQGEYLETPLLAFTDLITAQDDYLKVTEFKTSGRAYSESEAATSLQPTCYSHAVNMVLGKQAIIEYTVLIKTKTPKVQRLATTRYPDDFGRLGDLVQSVERGVQLGIFYPIESPMNCSGCAHRQHCREWGKPLAQSEPVPLASTGIEAQAC